MSPVPNNQEGFRPETNAQYFIRQIICLTTLFIHLSLFPTIDNHLIWLLLALYSVCYPLLVRFTPYIKSNAHLNVLFDCMLHGIFLSLWGFNPYLCVIYTSCITAISISTGGFSFGLRALAIIVAAAVLTACNTHFYFRPELPLTTLALCSTSWIVFIVIVGNRIYKVNTRLRRTKASLQKQKDNLIRLNNLASVVNSHLNFDSIMKSVMDMLETAYPFEAMYILSYKDDRRRLYFNGIFGSSITKEEKTQFKGFYFDVEIDASSVFVYSLLKKRVVYLRNMSPESVLHGAEIDQKLFGIKPSLCLAYFPIFVNEQVIGGACFVNYKTRFELSNDDIAQIQEYLIQVGTAVRNTAQLEELIQAKEMAVEAQNKAEASEESKSRFLANMSHEIRTPLTAIMGYSEAIEEGNLSVCEQNEFINHILRSSNHLLSMINDILDISKIEARKIEIENIDCNTVELFTEIESYLAIKCKEKNLKLSVHYGYPFQKTIHSDPTRLKQILLNLCNNAIKFTKDGTISISIATRQEQTLEVEISDTGIGIPPSVQEKIFGAFDQADTSTTRLHGGTGLGLYISQNLAMLLGGAIRVKSEENKGSTFTLTSKFSRPKLAPVILINNREQHTACINKIGDIQKPSKVPKLVGSVLLAEDNIENQKLISRLIRQTGMLVDIVDNGFKATKEFKQKNYQAVLMDMQMPIMGGKEAADKIRSHDPSIPIIAFTANVMKDQLAEYKNLGFYDVLEKPIIKEKLFNTLKSIQIEGGSSAPSVLVVEDNEVNQMILIRHIVKACPNSKVEIANNGQEAIDMIEGQSFDLIFMDMEMPIMNGLDATTNIRRLGYRTPIFIVSGNVDTDSIKQCFTAGATGHLSKPIDKHKILAVIEQSTQ